MNGAFRVPSPDNEPVRPHAPGDPERDSLKSVLDEVAATEVEIPLIIGGEEVRTGTMKDVIMPMTTRFWILAILFALMSLGTLKLR